jgi:hypothetical protein
MIAAKITLGAGALLLASSSGAFAQANPLRDAYFGESHLHTSWSLDAWLFGNRMTDPADAYKYFKGEPIKHPLGYTIQIDTPLDFAGVTDHSEYVGVIKLANTPSSPISKEPAAQDLILKGDTPQEMQRIFIAGTKLMGGPPVPALNSPSIAKTVWEETVQAAEEANQPGTFTAFCSYEWTSMPNNMNMHRNVFFKDCAHVPEAPYTAIDSSDPTDLWNWMDGQRQAGNELLAISHNANLSDGRMYPTEVDFNGRPIDRAYAESRMRNEPLIEIKQLKGQSETHPLLSPNDEFARYELFPNLLGNPVGRVPHVIGSFARQALKDGVTMQDSQGFNPYKFGFGAASDSHNTGVAYRQNNFFGGHAFVDGTPQQRLAGQLFAGIDPRWLGTAGLTGVWAEENTREAIFNAMQRKESFAVSGPQIKARFFGGWGYADGMEAEAAAELWKHLPDWLDSRDWIRVAYDGGVPMGGDLPAMPADGKAPTFVVWAVKDPTSGNLDRIQIIKGWTQSGQNFEKVFDVAWAGDREPGRRTGRVPPIESTVDVERGTYTNDVGAVELKGVWTDPEFDPGLHAFYYARVLEIPTPRWPAIQAAQLQVAPPLDYSITQERAWTSPIWYTPSDAARQKVKASPTVEELAAQGAVALTNDELTALIVKQSPWLQNNVTGAKYQLTYTAAGPVTSNTPLVPRDPDYLTQQLAPNQGQVLVRYVARDSLQSSVVGDLATASELGMTEPYYINDGKLVTVYAGTPISVTVYKQGDTYFAARSNEFGHVNYEVIPEVKELNPLVPGQVEVR